MSRKSKVTNEEEAQTQRDLNIFGLSQKFAGLPIAKNDADSGKLLGKGRKAFPGLAEIPRAFEAQISAVSILHQNVIAEFAGGAVQGIHKTVLSCQIVTEKN